MDGPMDEWYYACSGKQCGPVTLEQLSEIARGGGLDPQKDLVWSASMKDWTPAGQVPGVFAVPPLVAPTSDPANPYAAPQSDLATATEPVNLREIEPGSEPLDVAACVRRGFVLTLRHFGTIFLVGLVYFGAVVVMQQVLIAVGMSSADQGMPATFGVCVGLVSQVLSMWIGLGMTRIGLNLVSGKPVAVAQLFGEGDKLLRIIGASVLFALMVGLGVLLFIAPGIYLALRYGQYMVAIVDRDLGIMDAFAYSSALTTRNRLHLFLLGLLALAIILVGLLAFGIGLILAGPLVWLSALVAYRWMQYGHRATADDPVTATPVLSGIA